MIEFILRLESWSLKRIPSLWVGKCCTRSRCELLCSRNDISYGHTQKKLKRRFFFLYLNWKYRKGRRFFCGKKKKYLYCIDSEWQIILALLTVVLAVSNVYYQSFLKLKISVEILIFISCFVMWNLKISHVQLTSFAQILLSISVMKMKKRGNIRWTSWSVQRHPKTLIWETEDVLLENVITSG